MGIQPCWSLESAYVGAGRYAVKGGRVYAGTPNGVECLDPSRGRLWHCDLDSRTLAVLAKEELPAALCSPECAVTAVTRQGLFFLDEEGRLRREIYTVSREEDFTGQPLALDEGWIVPASSSLLRIGARGGVEWRLDLKDVLGGSVELARPIGLLACGGKIVTAFVDYDSGIGRVGVLDREGRPEWWSSPGPVTDLFTLSNGEFGWCESGYGKFETRIRSLEGREILRLDFAGTGVGLPDGRLALITGSNEAPAWDNWELRVLGRDGAIESSARAFGRCPIRPLVLEDGSLYFPGYLQRIDPSESRADYTSFFAQPQEVLFQHTLGFRLQAPDCVIYLQRAVPGEEVEVLYEREGSYSFGPPARMDDKVIFTDGRRFVAFEVRPRS